MTTTLAILSLIGTVLVGLGGLALAYYVRKASVAEARVARLEDALALALDQLGRYTRAQDILRRGRLAAGGDLDPDDVWGVLLDETDPDGS